MVSVQGPIFALNSFSCLPYFVRSCYSGRRGALKFYFLSFNLKLASIAAASSFFFFISLGRELLFLQGVWEFVEKENARVVSWWLFF